MIRRIFINNLVLNIYKQLPKLTFPIDIGEIFNLLPNCRCWSYQKFAEMNDCSIKDVAALCQSKSGCTHYDPISNRYLVLINRSLEDNRISRQRWTAAHEIGHIKCGHHLMLATKYIANDSLTQIDEPNYELEADYFAATLLAPFPLFNILEISSVLDIRMTFGISLEASKIRHKEYIIWKKSRRKTAWENDIINVYKQKNSLPRYGFS